FREHEKSCKRAKPAKGNETAAIPFAFDARCELRRRQVRIADVHARMLGAVRGAAILGGDVHNLDRKVYEVAVVGDFPVYRLDRVAEDGARLGGDGRDFREAVWVRG